MKRILIFFFFLSICQAQLFAQGETNNWFFFDHNGMTFNSGPPQIFRVQVFFLEMGQQ
jgi:hypothetical protein